MERNWYLRLWGGDTEPLYEYDLVTETSRQLFACEDPCLGDGEPAYSSDGSKVVFSRAHLPFVQSDILGEEVPSDCGLWIGDVATGEVKRLTGTGQLCDRREVSRAGLPMARRSRTFGSDMVIPA